MNILGSQKVSTTEVCDMKEEQPLPRFFGVQSGKDNLIFSSLNVEDLLIFRSIKEVAFL